MDDDAFSSPSRSVRINNDYPTRSVVLANGRSRRLEAVVIRTPKPYDSRRTFHERKLFERFKLQEWSNSASSYIILPTRLWNMLQPMGIGACQFNSSTKKIFLERLMLFEPKVTAPSLMYILPPEISHSLSNAGLSIQGEYELPEVINLMIMTAGAARGLLQDPPLEGSA